jgi:hypothetical protein
MTTDESKALVWIQEALLEQRCDAELEAFVRAGLDKGAEDIGSLDLSTDPRDFLDEAEEELRDALTYVAFDCVRAEPKSARQWRLMISIINVWNELRNAKELRGR